MNVLVLDPLVAAQIQAERAESGADRWDEVWDGVYVMAPLPNDEHQRLVARLTCILELVIGIPGLGQVRPGVNVSDREQGWEQNYRCPDVALFVRGGTAINRDAYWLGGPDFAVEILSPEDRVAEKLPFYAKLGVREVLVIDRDPWSLSPHRLREDGQLAEVGRSGEEPPIVLASAVVPLTFRLVRGEAGPAIEVVHAVGEPRWIV